jgi:SNF2 family DNA or RNA helicase
MQLLHIFYHTQTGFENTGTLYFWAETHHQIKKASNLYPFQLDKTKLFQVYENIFGSQATAKQIKVNLPCNSESEPVPSPIIGNIADISDRNITSSKAFNLNVIALDNNLKDLHALAFQSHYFEKNVQLAPDANFWITFSRAVASCIKKDQYIPEIIIEQSNNRYHTKWSFISEDLATLIKQQATIMPFSASLNTQFPDRESLLAHYAEQTLSQLISITQMPQRIHKLVENTFIDQALVGKHIPKDEYTWKECRLWRNNLMYEQLGAAFNLCFKLNEAKDQSGDDWSLEILLQSKEEPSFLINASEYWKTQKSKSSLYTKMLGTSVQKTLLLQLGYASRVLPLVEMFFKYKLERELLPLSTQEAFQFLKEDAWALKASGYRIMVPAWWTSKGRLRAKIKLKAKKQSSSESDSPTSYFSKSNLVRFDHALAIGGHEVTQEEWQALINATQPLVFFRGQWMEIDPKEMQKIQSLFDSAANKEDMASIKDLLVRAADDELYDVELDDEIQHTLDQLTGNKDLALLPSPDKLEATLRPYQIRGLSWMAFLENIGISPCLADDMGLGKTMQVISLLLAQPGTKPALLVAPTSVIGNWEREIEKFAPSLKTIVHHGGKRLKNESTQLGGIDLVITSFALCRKDKKIFEAQSWSRVIVDEAQNIKNPAAAQTKAICKLQADSRIALTGTPIENRLTDLWSIFHFLNPGYLGNKAYFKRAFEYPVQRDNDPYKIKVLKSLVEPFILRRVKTDKNIIQDLPDKVEQKVYCQLTKEQAAIYQNIVDSVTEKIKILDSKQDERALILSTLLKLKQVCNHPAQVLQDGSEFSVSRSMKLKRMIDIVSEAIGNNESILIFSQFTEICEMLNNHLQQKLGHNTYYLHGGTSRTKRESMINQFQHEDTQASIFILSLKAGGVGITLTKANHVIHFDRWWNPAVENQATDRAYRIGQNKTVFAHKFVTTGTIEERIDTMLEDKQKVSDMIVGNDESWLSKLDSKSFVDLIKLSQSEIASDTEELENAAQEEDLYDS